MDWILCLQEMVQLCRKVSPQESSLVFLDDFVTDEEVVSSVGEYLCAKCEKSIEGLWRLYNRSSIPDIDPDTGWFSMELIPKR